MGRITQQCADQQGLGGGPVDGYSLGHVVVTASARSA
jgi:hypothetical protein